VAPNHPIHEPTPASGRLLARVIGTRYAVKECGGHMDLTKIKNGLHFTAVDLGPLSQLDQYKFKHPALPSETDGKIFLNELLGLTSSERSAPDARTP
jgi:hypothetical protein